MPQPDDSGRALDDESNVSNDRPRPGPPSPAHPLRPSPPPRPTTKLEPSPRLPSLRPEAQADGPQVASSPAERPAVSVPSAASSSTAAAAAPAEAHLNGDSQLSDSGGMSGHHLHGLSGSHHGQPMGYPPSSGPYSSAGALPTSQYASYPSMTAPTQPSEPYRGSPVGSSTMSLPSMRTIDSMPQQAGGLPSPHHAMPMNMPVPMPPGPVAGGGMSFYPHHQPSISPSYGFPDAMPRYAMPHDPRLLGSRGPKKEIKRRTKTGCLTCRKRRIKCDETHPTCKNCHKSKRECLGYDPIFRQSPGSQSVTASLPADQPDTPTAPTAHLPSATLSSGAVSGPNNPYGSQPPTLSSTYATHSPPSTTVPTTGGYDLNHTATSAKLEPGYDYYPPATGSPSAHIKHEPAYHSISSSFDSQFRALPSTSIPDSSRLGAADIQLRATKMKIEEILNLLGPPPPAQQISHTQETFAEITKVYHEVYAPGLSAFFETNWYYFVDNGKMTFPKDAVLTEHMAGFLKILESVKAHDHSQMVYSGVLETRVVWELARTAGQTLGGSNASIGRLPPEGDPTEAKNRLQVFQALLCGDLLASNPLAPPVQDTDSHRVRQFDFWYTLAEFLRTRDRPYGQAAVNEREGCLGRMRQLLDGRENRDVLYSIAVVRELAPAFDPNYGSSLPQHLDETDPKNRLAVASKFIMDEAQVTGGTTNVVRRFSDIAVRAFVNPGVNVARRT